VGNYTVVEVQIEPEVFDSLLGIFSSIEEAMGAFLSLAEEQGWEKVPQSFVFYHAIFDGNRVIAGIKVDGQVKTYDQMMLEEMIRELASKDRVVVYSVEVIIYIKDKRHISRDRKTYSIAKAIAQKGFTPPSLEELAKLYGRDISTLELALDFIESLAEGKVRLPAGEVELPPLDAPLELC
jgi:DNA-binding protein YbaB